MSSKRSPYDAAEDLRALIQEANSTIKSMQAERKAVQAEREALENAKLAFRRFLVDGISDELKALTDGAAKALARDAQAFMDEMRDQFQARLDKASVGAEVIRSAAERATEQADALEAITRPRPSSRPSLGGLQFPGSSD